MNISKENQSKLNLLTIAEVSSLLKMNPQVINRKLLSGELKGYKLGKEWRVSEEQLVNFLEERSNVPKKSPEERILQTFFINGKLKEIPSSRSKREVVLKRLVSEFDSDVIYSEKEVNAKIKKYHDDVCTIRREFIGAKLMVRKDGHYKRTTWK